MVERGPGGAEVTALLQLNQLVGREVDLLLGHVAFVAILDQVGALKAQRRIHDADRRYVEDRSLALELRIEQFLPHGDFVADEVGPGRGSSRRCRPAAGTSCSR